MSLQINTPEAYKRLINNNVSKSVSLSYVNSSSLDSLGYAKLI